MFQKRKKFTEEVSPEKRMADRWEQQVFFILRKFPQVEPKISAIKKSYTPKKAGKDFSPCEGALHALSELYSDLQDAPLR